MAKKPFKVGDCVTLHLERRPIYARSGYVEAGRETLKTVEVQTVLPNNQYVVRSTRKPQRYFRLSATSMSGDRARYDVIEVVKVRKCRRKK